MVYRVAESPVQANRHTSVFSEMMRGSGRPRIAAAVGFADALRNRKPPSRPKSQDPEVVTHYLGAYLRTGKRVEAAHKRANDAVETMGIAYWFIGVGAATIDSAISRIKEAAK